MTTISIMNLITYYALMTGVDAKLALSVAKVESNYNQSVIGSHKEIGIFQILPSTVKNPKQLKNIHYNIQTGIDRLKEVKEKCKHKNQNDFVVCYNAGIYGGSKIKNPRKFNYVVKVNKQYNLLKKDFWSYFK